MTFWIGVACSDHTCAAVEGGFAQLGHGKHSAVKGLSPGDWIAYYAPTWTLSGGDTVQAFTSIGRVASEPYEAEATLGDAGRHPWRVDIDYETDAKAASIRPLLERLDLTRGKGAKWGMALRGSKVKGTDADLRLIAMAMAVQIDP